MDPASFIPQSNSHRTVFIQVKLFTVEVIVRSHPSNPDAGGVLSGKDADCVVALLERDGRRASGPQLGKRAQEAGIVLQPIGSFS